MSEYFNVCLWKNFGAAINMLDKAIDQCPDAMWEQEKKFYYLAFHTTIFLDYYLSSPVNMFIPHLPYTLIHPNKLPAGAIDDVMPAKTYRPEEVIEALRLIRMKCKNLILGATEKTWQQRWIQPEEVDMHGLCPSLVVDYSLLDIVFYNLRHVQHHVGQLNLLLRLEINMAPDWVSWVDD